MASIPQLISVGTRRWEMPACQAKEESLRYIYVYTFIPQVCVCLHKLTL